MFSHAEEPAPETPVIALALPLVAPPPVFRMAETESNMYIQNIANNSTYRTGAGFFNPTSNEVTVEFALYDGSGSVLGSPFTKIFIGYDYLSFNPFTEAGVPYPTYSYDNVYLRVRPLFGSGRLVCLGATANNNTNDPATHQAVKPE